MPSSRRAVLAAAALLALSACGSSGTASSSGSAADPATSATGGPLGFTTAQVGGGTIDFAALQGKPVGLWFWAPY